MRLERLLPALLCSLLVASGCGGGRGDGSALLPGFPTANGSLAFGLDLAALQAGGTPTITAATATVSRAGHDDITKTLTVVSGVATGQIDGLAPGYWHVAVLVYDGTTLIYTGAADVNVVAGVTVQCQLLFDPVVTAPTTGGIAITVGMNPMPGYSAINQAVSQILFDRPSARLYILDGTSNLIAVYDADTLVRAKDLAVPATPTAIALDRAGTGIYLGYSSGRIHRLDVASGTTSLVADALMQVGGMTALDGNLLMVSGPGSYSYSTLKVLDVTTGQIVSTRAPYFSLAELLYNPLVKTVYAHHLGVSPTDIHYVKLDASGNMTADGDSIYHGDYGFGRPLRLINAGTRLATSSGAMFTSAELVANDLRYSGSLGYTYVDLSADDTLGKLYLLYAGATPKLLVIDQGTYFVELTSDLTGTPFRVFDTATSIVVFSSKDARTFAKAFSKADLGL